MPAGATRWQAAGGAPHDSEARRGAKDGDILPGWPDRSMENAGNRMELVVIGLVEVQDSASYYILKCSLANR